MITVGNNAISSNHTKVTFLNVPKYVPDEELVHFCSTFGDVIDPTVYYGKYQGGKFNGLKNGTRWIEADIYPSRRQINFIWLEGPCASHLSSRITVTYGAGRERQCGHCLKTSKEGCLGFGKAKICRERKGERASADVYMKNLEELYGYKTLKSTYEESLSDENASNNEDKEDNDDTSENRSETQEVNKMKREIITLKAEMKARKDEIDQNEEKIKVLRKNIMKHLRQSLSDPLFETSSMSLLVTQLSLTLTNDEYEVGECGVARLKSETVFKELSLNYDNDEDTEVARANL